MSALSRLAQIPKIPELRRRILFTLMIIGIYRFGVYITIPGIDRNALTGAFGAGSGLLSMFNMFSGGALGQGSIFALGLMPYISASIIMQLMGMISKRVEEMKKEGEAGRRKIEQLTRYGTVLLAGAWGYGMYGQWLGIDNAVPDPSIWYRLLAMLTLMTGTLFLMWMGERATERGIGNGISVLILASIISGIPGALQGYWMSEAGEIPPLQAALVIGIVLVSVGTVVFFERAQRRIPIQYARRQVGRRVYGQHTAHLPLKVNMASMIPPIFASTLLMLPATLATMNLPDWAGGARGPLERIAASLGGNGWVFQTVFAALIVFFCFFYTAVTFQPVDVADNLQKQQANIPGIRPGKQTAEYIDRVLTRLTVAGSSYVAAICVVPAVVAGWMGVPFQFGGTSLMIVVGVALETSNQIEAHLITHSYEGADGPRSVKVTGRRTRG